MNTNKLELKHYVAYLLHDVQVLSDTYIDEKKGVHPIFKILNASNLIDFFSGSKKLILLPLSDLRKTIEINGKRFVPYKKLYNIGKNLSYSDHFISHYLDRFTRNLDLDYILSVTPYFIIQKLLEWHFDIFGLIKSGLAIDINTIKN